MPRNLEKIALKETQNNEIELQKSKDRKAHYAIGCLAVIANRNQAFQIRHKGRHHEKFVPSRRISYTLSYVRVTLGTSDVQSILDIPATDEIHMEDRNHGLAWTKPNSDIYNTQHSQQTCALRVNFKSCGYITIKGEITLYNELQKFSSIR